MKRLLTTKEAAAVLGVSEARVRQLLLAGRIRGAKHLGRDWTIPMPIKISKGSRGPIGTAGR